MAFREFDGELDTPAGFVPFDGELDKPVKPAVKKDPSFGEAFDKGMTSLGVLAVPILSAFQGRDWKSDLGSALEDYNAMPSSQVMGNVAQAYEDNSGIMAPLAAIKEAVTDPVGVAKYLTEMLPAAGVGGGIGGGVAKGVALAAAKKYGLGAAATELAANAAAGSGFNAGATALGGIAPNTAQNYQETGNVDDAISKGAKQTAAETGVAALLGAPLNVGANTLKNVALKALGLSPADETLQTIAGNAAIGKDTSGGEIAASAVLGAAGAPGDIAGATLFKEKTKPNADPANIDTVLTALEKAANVSNPTDGERPAGNGSVGAGRDNAIGGAGNGVLEPDAGTGIADQVRKNAGSNDAAVAGAAGDGAIIDKRLHGQRKLINDMSVDELRNELMTDHLTGLKSARWMDENASNFKHTIAFDADSLKWVNDNLGHDSGDKLLQAWGEALSIATDSSARKGGDEFFAFTNDDAEVNQIVSAVDNFLKNAEITVQTPDGVVTMRGIGVSYGVGKNRSEADAKLNQHKDQREAAGLRAPRGERPPNVFTESLAPVTEGQQNTANQTPERESYKLEQPAGAIAPAPDRNVSAGAEKPEVPARARGKAKPKQVTLLTALRKYGVSNASKSDVVRDKFAPGGYNQVFRNDSRNTIEGLVGSGELDEFLPYELRFETQNDPNKPPPDMQEAAEWIKEKIANGERVIPYDAAVELEQNGYEAQAAIDAVANLLSEDEINAQLQIAAEDQARGRRNAEVFNPANEDIGAESSAGTETREPGQDDEEIAASRAEDERKAANALTTKPVVNQKQESVSNKPERDGVRQHVEALIKRRSAANQMGKGRIFDSALSAAKSLLNGDEVKPSKFKNAAAALSGDKVMNDALMALHGIAKANVHNQAETAGKTLPESSAGAAKSDGAQTDLLGDNTAKQQAVADAERAKDEKRNAGESNANDFALTGSDRPADQAAARGAQDLFADTGKRPEVKLDDVGEKLGGAKKDKGVAMFSRSTWYYSQLSKAIESAKFETAPANQWKLWLNSNAGKLGVKLDEIYATGILDYLTLQQGKVSKADIQEYLKANGVQIQDVILGREYNQDGSEKLPSDGETKYSTYTIPGGENYHELLLTLPKSTLPDGWRIEETNDGKYAVYNQYGSHLGNWPTRESAEKSQRKQSGGNGFFSSHFDQPNILSHVRFDERTDADGNRVLFIHEVQSDWGQKGKKEGFSSPENIAIQKRLSDVRKRLDEIRNMPAEKVGLEERQLWEEQQRLKGAVPAAPFVTDTKAWVSLSIKRMIAYAVDNGFDKVAFISGQQAADLYDLSKQVDRVEYWPDSKIVTAYKDGVEVIRKSGIEKDDLPDVIGKDAAKKLLDEPMRGNAHQLYGNDLKVGGEGMRTFYDQIVPQVANDVLKKVGGGKVESVKVTTGETFFEYEPVRLANGKWAIRDNQSGEPTPLIGQRFDSENSAMAALSALKAESMSQTGFTITPAVREKVAGGLPLFAKNRSTGNGIGAASAQKLVDNLLAKWKNAPDIVVVDSMNDPAIPQPVRDENERQLSQGATGQPDGFFYKGKVYLVADQLRNEKDVARVLFHETLGHYGLRGAFGKAMNPVLGDIIKYRKADVIAKAKQYGLNPNSMKDLAIAAEEVLAEMAQTHPNSNYVKRAIALIRQVLRDIGIDLELTDNDIIATYLIPARRFVENGGKPGGGIVFSRGMRFSQGNSQADTINVDGIDRPAMNSNGQRIAQTDEGLRNFWRWFGDSKVVDDQGRPLVVYHGTAYDFDIFDAGRNRTELNDKYQGDGFHFSTDPQIASRYADANRNLLLRKRDIYPLVEQRFPKRIAKLFRDVVEQGYEKAWDLPDAEISEVFQAGRDANVDLNDLLDLAEVVEGSRYNAGREGANDPGGVLAALFGGSGGGLLSEYHVNSMVTMGLDDAAPAQNVMPVYLKAEKPLNTDSREKAKAAQQKGYDGVLYSGPDLVGGVPEWVVFDPTQIKSAIGNNGQFDQNNPDIRYSRATNKSQPASKGGGVIARDELGRFKVNNTLYEKLVVEKAVELAKRSDFAQAPAELRKMIRKMKADEQNAVEVAGDVAKSMKDIGQPERALVSDVIENMLKTGVTPPDHVVKIAASMSGIMDKQTDDLVALGMLSKDSAERWRGKYLPRFYNRENDPALAELNPFMKAFRTAKPVRGLGGGSLKGRGLYEPVAVSEVEKWEALGWEVRDPLWKKNQQGKLELVSSTNLPDAEKVVMWRDFTPQEREAMGENRDALYRFVMGYTSMQKDIALGRLFDQISKNQEWVRSRASEGFTLVPDSDIPDTGGVKRYGNLAGLYVRDDILSHISQYEASSELMQGYRKALGLWKAGKTVLNPVSHMNNIISNITMAHFAGVSYVLDVPKYIGALRDLAKGADMVSEAKEQGLFSGDLSREEFMDEMPDDIKAMMDMQDSALKKGAKAVFKIATFGLAKPMSKAYRLEDDFFKYLIYRDARSNGMAPADAVDYATQFIFTYDDLPKNARRVRDAAIPFFAYTYKAVPALLNTAMYYPWRFAAPAALIAGVNAAAFSMLGDDADEDDERSALPPWMQGRSALGTNKTIRLGNDEKTGLPIYWDVSRFIPGGDLFDVNNQDEGLPLPAPVMPSNPILTSIAALVWNKDTFTGKEVVDKNDTGAETAEKRAAWAYKTIMPAIAPYNRHWDNLMNAAAGEMDTVLKTPFKDYTGIGKDGLPVQGRYALMNTVGIKAKPVDLELSKEIAQGQDMSEARSIKSEVRQAARMLDKGAISQDEYDEIERKAMEKIGRIAEKM